MYFPKTKGFIALLVLIGIIAFAVTPTSAVATLCAPMVLVAFARMGVPLAAAQPDLAIVAPIVGAVVSLLCALWLLSDLGRSTTGEVVHVDAGFHIMGFSEDEAEG